MNHSRSEAHGPDPRSRRLALVEPGRSRHVLQTVTVVLQGRHCGTFPLDADLDATKLLYLYVVPSPPHDAARSFDCLVTDEPCGDDPEPGTE
jgi:hypothetical protein